MRIFLAVIFIIGAWFLSYADSQNSNASLYGHYLKGLYLLQKGDYEAGLKELAKTKEQDPSSIYARLKMATVLIRLGRTAEAEKILQEAKRLDPDNLEISLALIFIYSYAKNDTALENEYEQLLIKAHQKKPQDVGISEYLAQFYFYKKNFPDAIMIYETILKQNPEYVEAYFWLGYLYREQNDTPKAIEMWRKGLEIEPTHASILNSLGYTYAEDGINLDEAETMIKKALEQEPDNGAYLDSLGWVYFKKGNLEEARQYLQQALEKAKDPDIYEHLGDVEAALGKIDEALEYYRQGSEQFPDNESLKLRLKKYEPKPKNKRSKK